MCWAPSWTLEIPQRTHKVLAFVGHLSHQQLAPGPIHSFLSPFISLFTHSFRSKRCLGEQIGAVETP